MQPPGTLHYHNLSLLSQGAALQVRDMIRQRCNNCYLAIQRLRLSSSLIEFVSGVGADGNVESCLQLPAHAILH